MMSDTRKLSEFLPKEARAQFRNNKMTDISCCQFSAGYLQANIACLPSAMADEFEKFCNENSSPLPFLCRNKPGEVSAPTLIFESDFDVRTDLPLYCVSEHGVITKHCSDVTDIPWGDMVSFYIGCSFSFDHIIAAAGIPLRHMIENRNPPIYVTKIPLVPVGPFGGGMVVSVRAIPRELLEKVAEICVPLTFAHGAPIHFGDPDIIGIEDYLHPLEGDKPIIHDGDVLVFWGCGISATEAFITAKPPIGVSISLGIPGSLLITDRQVLEYSTHHPPKYDNLKLKVIFLSESPQFASLVSQQATEQITNIERDSQDNLTSDMNNVNGFLVKSVLTLSHASSVAMVTCGVSEQQLIAAVWVAKAMLAQDKEITILASEGDVPHWVKFLSKCEAAHVLKKPIPVTSDVMVSCDLSRDVYTTLYKVVRCLGPSFSETKLNAVTIFNKEGKMAVQSLLSFQEISPDTSRAQSDKNGQRLVQRFFDPIAVSTAMFILHQCPIHNRYQRRGRGEQNFKQANEFFVTREQFGNLGIAIPDVAPLARLDQLF